MDNQSVQISGSRLLSDFISDHHQTNWAPYLPIAQFAHNNWPSETTRKSPFFLLMGYHPRADWISSASPLPQVTLRLEQLEQARDTAQQLMIKAQQSWVKHRDTPRYKEGNQVWLEGKNLRINQPTAKLAPRRHGPFKVIKVLSPVSYQLALPMQWSIHPVFHIDLLTPYRETITHGPNYQRPVPELVDGEEEYSVEKILDSRKSAEDGVFNIWSSGRGIRTRTTCGSIRMTYSLMIRCGSSRIRTPPRKHI
jgi:hypothetical protein